MKGIINLNKKDINGQPWEKGLSLVPEKEQYRYWSWGYYEWKGVPSYCNRCGYKDEFGNKVFYTHAKHEKELSKSKDGYYYGYCELDAWAKGYSRAYEYKKELAYDYIYAHGQAIDEKDKEYKCYQWKSDSCGACEDWQEWTKYAEEKYWVPNQEGTDPWTYKRFEEEALYNKELFNKWYWGDKEVNDLFGLFYKNDKIWGEWESWVEGKNPLGHLKGDMSVEEWTMDKQAFYNWYKANKEMPTKENRSDKDWYEIFKKDYDNKN